jgi:hypothetical protein
VADPHLPALTPGAVDARARREAAASGSGTDDVRHLHSTSLCADELCFSAFVAPSVDALRRANDRAAMPDERITEALCSPGDRQQ